MLPCQFINTRGCYTTVDPRPAHALHSPRPLALLAPPTFPCSHIVYTRLASPAFGGPALFAPACHTATHALSSRNKEHEAAAAAGLSLIAELTAGRAIVCMRPGGMHLSKRAPSAAVHQSPKRENNKNTALPAGWVSQGSRMSRLRAGTVAPFLQHGAVIRVGDQDKKETTVQGRGIEEANRNSKPNALASYHRVGEQSGPWPVAALKSCATVAGSGQLRSPGALSQRLPPCLPCLGRQ